MPSKCHHIKRIVLALSLAASINMYFNISASADTAANAGQTAQSASSAESNPAVSQSQTQTGHDAQQSEPEEENFPAHITNKRIINQTANINDAAREDGIYLQGPALTSQATLQPSGLGSQHDGQLVTISEVDTTIRNNGRQYVYAKVTETASNTTFWIDSRALLATITSQRSVNYAATIRLGSRSDNLFPNAPALSSWESLTGRSADNVNGHQVTVIQEAVTLRGNGRSYTYLQVHDPAINQDYWLDQRAFVLGQYASITSQTNVNQYAQIIGSRDDNIYTNGPALTSLASLDAQGKGSAYQGRYLQVRQVAITKRSTGLTYTYAQVYDPQNKISFWIDTRSLAIADYAAVIKQTAVNQSAVIRDSYRNDAVYENGPALTNSDTLAPINRGQALSGRTVTVLQTVKTRRNNGQEYDYLEIRDGSQTYWIDQRAVLASVSYKNVAYSTIINTINRTDNLYWNGPALTNWDTLSSTVNDQHYNGRQVQILQEAVSTRGDGSRYTYLKVQDGLSIYWLDKRAFLFPNQSVMLRYTHFNQNWQGAPEGCEGTSLQIALSTKSRSASLRQIYNATGYGWQVSPYNGFHGNPFGGGRIETQTVYAAPFARAAKKFDPGAADMTGASINDVIYQLQQGNPVITWGSFSWTLAPANFHVMCIVGYRPGAFRIADPAPYLFGNSYWISTDTWHRVNQNEKAVGFTTPQSMNVVIK